MFKKIVFVVCLSWGAFVPLSFSQKVLGMDEAKKASYLKAIELRSAKIVAALNLQDARKSKDVVSIVSAQYIALNNIYYKRDCERKNNKDRYQDNKAKLKDVMASSDVKAEKKVARQHAKYLKRLSRKLDSLQISEIKDGMTYKVLPITYHAYMEMLPTLKPNEKQQIWNWLVEAREYAIDGETSEKKHAWFGKYKGRINNYLSKLGYDMKTANAEFGRKIKPSPAVK